MKRVRTVEIRLILLVVFGLLVLGIAAAGVNFYAQRKANLKERTLHELSAIAELKVREISGWRSDQVADVRFTVRNPFTEEAVLDYLARPAEARLRRQVEAWMQGLQQNYGYRNIILLDRAGTVRAAVPGSAAVDPHILEQALKAAPGSGPILLDFHRTGEDGQLVLSLFTALPDPDHPTGEPVGFFVLDIDPHRYLYPLIQLWPTPSKTAETLLVERQGDEVVFLNELRHRKGTALTLRHPLSESTLPATRAARGLSGTMEGLDYRGKPVFSAYRPIPDSPWALVAKVDQQEVQADLRQDGILLGALVAALLVAAGAILLFIDRQQAARFHQERQAARKELGRARAQLLFATVAADLGTWHWDIAADELIWNARCKEFFGYSEDFPMSYEAFLQPIHDEDQLQVDAAVQKALREKTDYFAEMRVKQPDGTIRWVMSKGRAFYDEEDRPLHMHGIAMDITKRKQSEEALRDAKAAAEEASRAKSEFLANMSHEIRTPMTVFLAAIEHLLQVEKNPEQVHLLGMADQSAKRLRLLIDDVLDLSRIEARRVKLEEEPFELRACLREAMDMFALPAREKNLRLETDVSSRVPELVVGDSARLGQVLINLVGNAVKFTHEGEIRVSVQPHGDRLEFAVADTGIGIPENKWHLLFQSFSQVDGSFTRNYGGTGLGLAISRGLVELMGGEITVQSREGEGSVFTFTLPLKIAEQQIPLPPETAPECSGEKDVGVRILLAEDEPMVREMIAMMLARRGWQATTAGSGREAVESWEGGRFDVILMDLQMPEMDGLAATRTIREKEGEGSKRTCIIGLTAHARPEIKEECLASGMDHVLTKPVQMQDLFSVIETCFRCEIP